MKQYASSLLIALAALSCLTPSYATEKRPTIAIAENQKSDVNKCVRNIKSLPREIRECMLAEMSEFLYMDDGSCPFEANGKKYYLEQERCWYKKVKQTAKYIGTDGKPYSFYSVIRKRAQNEKWTTKWRQSKFIISQVGWDTIAQFFEEDIQKLQELYTMQLDKL